MWARPRLRCNNFRFTHTVVYNSSLPERTSRALTNKIVFGWGSDGLF
jgi:hypothetical protein